MKSKQKNFISRRQFLQVALAGLGTAGLASTLPLSTFASYHGEGLDTGILKIQLPQKHRDLHGFRIGVLSDIHHGRIFDISLLRSSLDFFVNQKTDLLLLAGDFVWISDSLLSQCFPVVRNKQISALPIQRQASAALAELRTIFDSYRFPFGSLAIFGNHDHWSAHRASHYYLNGSSMRLLKNEAHSFVFRGHEIEIFGADDYWTGKPKLSGLTLSKSSEPFRILLAHNPDYASFVQQSSPDLFQLAVCGHTHGGQIKIPGYGALIKNVQDQRFVEGLSFAGNFPVFTTRGLGTVEIPFRFHCPPEAKILQLAV